MKVLVIYANDCKTEVDSLRKELADTYGESTILRLHSTNRKKSIFRHAWHKDAVKMMRCADIIVYAVSPNSSTNKNVEWELKKALKLNKYIVYLPMREGLEPKNKCLKTIDKNTKQEICLADAMESKERLRETIDDFNKGAYIKLFDEDKKIDKGVLLEQYKVFSETAENLLNRRQTVNNFYITANTALITIAGTIFAVGSEADFLSKVIVVFALTIPGILLNISWLKMLQTYYINNQGKMKILSMVEKELGASMYDAEWKAMKNKYSKKKYTSFTDNEKKLPMVFLAFFLLVDIVSLVFFALLLFRG